MAGGLQKKKREAASVPSLAGYLPGKKKKRASKPAKIKKPK